MLVARDMQAKHVGSPFAAPFGHSTGMKHPGIYVVEAVFGR
jgi:hypothetical protein